MNVENGTRKRNGAELNGQIVASGIGEGGWTAILCVVCLAILFVNLGGAAFFEPDEGRNAEKAREILLLDDWVTPHHNFLPTLDKPMASYWLVAISFKLFGFSEWAARLPSALAAIGCLVLLYRFAHRLWGSPAALWSCLVLATSIEFFMFARLAILDMSLTLFLSWTMFSFYLAAHTDNPRSRLFCGIAMYVAIGVGTLIKGPIAVVLPGMVFFAYLLLQRQWSLLQRLGLARGALILFAIVTPWYLWTEIRNPGYLRYFLWQEHIVRYSTPTFKRGGGWYYFFIVLAAGFLPWNFLLPQMVKHYWKKNVDEANLFLALWVILPFVFFSFSNSKLPHYILPIFPALALLMGRFLAEKFSDSSANGWNILITPWLFTIGLVVYLLLGAAWPNILATQVSEAAAKSVWILAVGGILLLAAFVLYLNPRLIIPWNRWEVSYLTMATGLVIFCFLLGHMMIAISPERSSKSLAHAAAMFIAPEDRVGFYDTYLTGIAFYLAVDTPLWIAQSEDKHRIMGSSYLGARRPGAAARRGQVVISFDELAREWHQKNLVLRVFVKEKNLQRLSRDVGATPRILTQFDEYLLVTNR
jgi:4-amino-4-deoxy-L-arabinose transferase-like glycosyltransferase